ncbi:MAG: pyridine nucleotide-disulfide oxidoreductase, partial [Fastidiosipila sp.]|nr:pyridine nucleotide-disulfide oxidoreductase [Fastidiosipila sp.]
MITNRIPLKSKKRAVTVDDPEYWGLAGSITDEMAEIALKMKVRTPRTFDEIQELTDIEPVKLQELLDEMSYMGFLEYNRENPEREKQYVVPLFVPGSAEFFNMNWEHLQENPELAAFFERMAFMTLEKITPMIPPGGAGIGMHVIPVEKAIPMENETADVEHISHWLKKYEGKYAASPCSCRYAHKIMNEGCADDPEDWCITLGDMADYVVETNKGGRYIDYDEVMRILKKAEDRGYVHQITNIDGENKI